MRTYTLLTEARFYQEGKNPETVRLPHTWNNLDGQDGGADYYRGACRYEIALPNPTEGKRQYVEFRGANHVATVSCNGTELGTHKGGFSTFRFDLTDAMKEKDNLLTVTVTNEICDVYPQRADFTFFGGLYRKAFFIEAEEAHFDLLKDGTNAIFVSPYVSGLTRVDLFPVNAEGCEIQITLLDAEGNAVAENVIPAEAHSFADITVTDPHLWNGMADPYLYRAVAKLLRDGKELDCVETSFGYRSYHVDPENGFFLNGKSLPLRGVCRHQDRQDMGWAISEKEHKEDLDLICEIGANTIRLAHYQHDQYFYDLCDKAGFILWAEIPYISQHRPGKDAYENTLSQMKELIAQNYNHPAICFWGIANEITIGGYCEEQHRNLRDLNALCKAMDPSRLTTMAQLSRVPVESSHNQVTDIFSYNIYHGWYIGDLPDNEAAMDALHKAYPDKPIGISEYGADHLLKWHSATPFNHDYTEEYACVYHHHMLKMFSTRPWLWATHVWNMFDFAVDQRNEGGIKGRNCKGLITFDRKTKKDTFFLYKAFWTTEPMVHVAGRRFADRAPEERTVSVYTNLPRITLYLNGAEYATVEAIDHVASFENVPLKDGENVILAKGEGAEDSIVLNGVAEHNGAYDLPDIAAALQAGNWFLEEDADVDYGDEGYSIQDTMSVLCATEETLQVMRGWVMNCDSLLKGEKFNALNRLPKWKELPVGMKKPPEMKLFRSRCTEEDFALLDRRLHAVKRK